VLDLADYTLNSCIVSYIVAQTNQIQNNQDRQLSKTIFAGAADFWEGERAVFW